MGRIGEADQAVSRDGSGADEFGESQPLPIRCNSAWLLAERRSLLASLGELEHVNQRTGIEACLGRSPLRDE